MCRRERDPRDRTATPNRAVPRTGTHTGGAAKKRETMRRGVAAADRTRGGPFDERPGTLQHLVRWKVAWLRVRTAELKNEGCPDVRARAESEDALLPHHYALQFGEEAAERAFGSRARRRAPAHEAPGPSDPVIDTTTTTTETGSCKTETTGDDDDEGCRPRLVGLCGAKGSGKSTVAAHLCRAHGYEEVTFAGPLKAICGIVFDLSPEQLDGSLKEALDPRLGVSPREILQAVGTELFRVALPEALPGLHLRGGDPREDAPRVSPWIHAACVRVRELMEGGKRVVISDARFPDEIEALRRLGAFVVRIDRPSRADSVIRFGQHASERGIPDAMCDRLYVNESALDELPERFDRLLSAARNDSETREVRQ